MDRKITYALIAGAAYIVFSYPAVYKLTNTLTQTFNVNTSNSAGCPTISGLVLHGAVVAGIIYALLAQNYIIAIAQPPPPTPIFG